MATALPFESLNFMSLSICMEETSTLDLVAKINNGSSGLNRLSPFWRMLSSERSSRIIQPCGQEVVVKDLELQCFDLLL